jgi:ABC-type branched-subunit amino acid transport system substrate-binding protein
MTSRKSRLSRRTVLAGSAAGVGMLAMPQIVRAQGEPIKLGSLTPLTGAGGPYGPPMRKAIEGVIEGVNKAGGVLGRRVELAAEDDQTNPDAAVRAARKLIDVDKVCAIMGTWASSVTTAVAPLCWESKVFLTTVSGSDTITLLPHQGYLVRTQPNTVLQMRKLAEFVLSVGTKRMFILSAQTPFAQPSHDQLTAALPKGGGEVVGAVIYDKDKTSFRSEVDQALKAKPDMIYLNGYTPDITVLAKDLYRAGYTGNRIAQGYAANQKFLDGLPADVSEGIYAISPSPAVESTAYKRVAALLGTADVDPYSAQCNDHASLVCLAIAKAGEASGTAIKDTIRKVSQGSGIFVDNAVEGLKLLKEGKEINYDGASGPCDFTDIGDIIDTKFRYEQAEKGKLKTLRIA